MKRKKPTPSAPSMFAPICCLPPTPRRVKALLTEYLDHRLVFFTTRDEQEFERINKETVRLQDQMWSVVAARCHCATNSHPRPRRLRHERRFEPSGIYASSVVEPHPGRRVVPDDRSGNLLQPAGWLWRAQKKGALFTVLPFLLAVAFFLIADIDSPRRGVIRVRPQNLLSLSDSLHKQ